MPSFNVDYKGTVFIARIRNVWMSLVVDLMKIFDSHWTAFSFCICVIKNSFCHQMACDGEYGLTCQCLAKGRHT